MFCSHKNSNGTYVKIKDECETSASQMSHFQWLRMIRFCAFLFWSGILAYSAAYEATTQSRRLASPFSCIDPSLVRAAWQSSSSSFWSSSSSSATTWTDFFLVSESGSDWLDALLLRDIFLHSHVIEKVVDEVHSSFTDLLILILRALLILSPSDWLPLLGSSLRKGFPHCPAERWREM